MNAFTSAVLDKPDACTENGAQTYSTSLSALVDLFFQVGALRTQPDDRIDTLFSNAFRADPEKAVRIALWARNVRGGAGERRVFRRILVWLEANNPEYLARILHLIPAVGRWDDLFSILNNTTIAQSVLTMYGQALRDRNGLAAKWAPREKSNKLLAARLRGFMRLNASEYRRLITSGSKTVEQQMCAKNWGEITYSHVPSVASARYTKAFRRNDADRYGAYINAVKERKVDPATGEIAKINTEALFPYDVTKPEVLNSPTADALWDNLPNYVPEGLSFIPMIDVSSSMEYSVGAGMRAMDVAVSIGMYLAERGTSAFKNIAMTFAERPSLFTIPEGTLAHRVSCVKNQSWGGSTDVEAGLALIAEHGREHNVPQAEMPKMLIVISDMEFNANRGGTTAFAGARQLFKSLGYEMPAIVWWNVVSRNGVVPVRANQGNTALVSGMSPAVVKGLLGGEINPTAIMMKTIMDPQYDH